MQRTARHACIVGIQWGDEGKGKIVDALSPDFDVIVRYQGGANAGHTVKVGDQEFVFHLIPSGILQEGKTCVIGNGVVVDPMALIKELDQLKKWGFEREQNLYISERAHVVLPYHKSLDAAKEGSAARQKIGTTLRGIGPCYTDKAARLGIRMGDLIDPDRFAAMLEVNVRTKNAELVQIYGHDPISFEATLEEYTACANRLRPRVCDISRLLWENEDAGKRVLFEGAQGSLLDVDQGTYPFVTSSNTSFLGLGAGTGFSPRHVDSVLGITKAYCTRVGEGPFPTELRDATGEALRKQGHEFGATTGRPRRCGWLDAVALRYAIRFSDVDALIITKLDVLDGLDEIKVCTRYSVGGTLSQDFPTFLDDRFTPHYETLRGWKKPTSACRSWNELPVETRRYLQFVVDTCKCPISMVSVGKDRSALIRLDPWLMPASSKEAPAGSQGGIRV